MNLVDMSWLHILAAVLVNVLGTGTILLFAGKAVFYTKDEVNNRLFKKDGEPIYMRREECGIIHVSKLEHNQLAEKINMTARKLNEDEQKYMTIKEHGQICETNTLRTQAFIEKYLKSFDSRLVELEKTLSRIEAKIK